MSISTRRLTYDDLAQMPDDGKRYEILDGELVVTAAPVPKHQQVSGRYVDVVRPLVREQRLGEVYVSPIDVKLSEYDVVQPDLIYVSNERRHIVGDKFIEGAPDLVVEILSPSTRVYDEVHKARLYAAAGVLEYWIVDLDARTVRVYQLTEDGYSLVPNDGDIAQSHVIPGLAITISALFTNLW